LFGRALGEGGTRPAVSIGFLGKIGEEYGCQDAQPDKPKKHGPKQIAQPDTHLLLNLLQGAGDEPARALLMT
jgi:hypothetical protein